ncbi:hypothetical protein GEV33_000383 [Tenebrio molitor]|uniref:Uncharacterized protein n=1 Tax=Tenebrio molitor TaxID=7067 RepID=A0A8J6HZM6_TENMO|nr:hypothetical protein GEV33_000383 [Tenebrio molitor]
MSNRVAVLNKGDSTSNLHFTKMPHFTSKPVIPVPKGSTGRDFAVPMRTEHRDQASFCPFALREVSVLAELALGHLRYSLTDVPPQSNSPPGSVLESDHAGALIGARNVRKLGQPTGPHARTYGHGTTPAATPGTSLCALGSRTP